MASNKKSSSATEVSGSRVARFRRMMIRRRFKFMAADQDKQHKKRKRPDQSLGDSGFGDHRMIRGDEEVSVSGTRLSTPTTTPWFGVTSVCGMRKDMEDLVAIHPSFCSLDPDVATSLHYFGVFDGHGCSHVATKCGERLHKLVKEELENGESPAKWEEAMERSFSRMDNEVMTRTSTCRCDLQATDQSGTAGSTAVVSIVTPDKIVLANCGDSRAVLCRNGKAVPLSSDHKPDRPDELKRIQDAGGRVIYWDEARVLGVLAMSRSIGDRYLKPCVSCQPEVTITDRTAEDECLILASDGLWDVVSNDAACGVARMCLRGEGGSIASGGGVSESACSDASVLLAKLASARGSADNISVVVIDLWTETLFFNNP